MHSLADFVKQGYPFPQDLFLKIGFLSVFFSSIDPVLCLYAQFEVLSINPSANVFVLGDFNVHHKDWLFW